MPQCRRLPPLFRTCGDLRALSNAQLEAPLLVRGCICHGLVWQQARAVVLLQQLALAQSAKARVR